MGCPGNAGNQTSRVKEQYDMKYFKMVGLCLVVVFALSAVAVSAAQAEETKGPLWIVGSHGTPLATGETRAITSRSEGVYKLRATGPTVVECKETINSGFLLGGEPGTDYTQISFKKCFLEKNEECVATGLRPLAAPNKGEAIVDALTALAYASGTRESAVDLFAPESEANLFVEFELTGASCKKLENAKIEVLASGSEITIKSEKRKCGTVAEVGHTVAGAFVLSKPGEVARIGLLNLPQEVIKNAEFLETIEGKSSLRKIECGFETQGAIAGKAAEVGTSIVEINKPVAGEEFGWGH
jgi:hypothetical protein